MFHRLLPPTAVVRQTIRAHGRTYSGSPGQVLDVPDIDAGILEANGWLFICLSGPTGERPYGTNSSVTTTTPVSAGLRYFDTDLSKLIAYDGATWRDIATGNAV